MTFVHIIQPKMHATEILVDHWFVKLTEAQRFTELFLVVRDVIQLMGTKSTDCMATFTISKMKLKH